MFIYERTGKEMNEDKNVKKNKVKKTVKESGKKNGKLKVDVKGNRNKEKREKKESISKRIKKEITNKEYGKFGFFDEFIRYCYWLFFMMLNVFVLFEIKRPFGLVTPWYIWVIIALLFLVATYLEYVLYRKIWPKKKKEDDEGREESKD
jgi:hypothetical protein